MDEIINYVTNTPENTNPNVLKSMLTGISSSGGYTPFIITYDGESFDKTFEEIITAKNAKIPIYFIDMNEYGDDGTPFPVFKVVYYEGDDNLSISVFQPLDYIAVFTLND